MKPYVFISALYALVASCICNVQGRITFKQEVSCPTSSGGTDDCVSLYDCPTLMAIAKNWNKSQEHDKFDELRRAQCGFVGDIPKVCCPAVPPVQKDCLTPDGQIGICVGIDSCPYLAKMQKESKSTDPMAFIQNSRCEGPEKFSVCCGVSPNMDTRAQVCTMTAEPPDPTTRCCGEDSSADDKIVGGEVAAIDQYPWMVIIEYVKDNEIKLLCGGVLISGKYVLTAGHCVVGQILHYGTPINVRLGEYDTTHDGPDCAETAGGGHDCTQGVTIIPIEKIIPHPDYPRNHLRRNDIALIRLKSMAPYTDFIRPICLPQSDVTANPPTNPLMFFVAGWGAVNKTLCKSNIKLYVNVPYKSQEECQPAYSVPKRNVTLWNGQLCAGGVAGKDSCRGDSGSPLMYAKDKIHEVVGIASFGASPPCGFENIPGVYTKVYEYNTWIRNTIEP